MTAREWLAIPMVLTLLGALLGAVWVYVRRFSPAPEGARKLFHVGSGLVALTLPWLFHSAAPIAALCGLTLAIMLALKHVPAARRGPGQVLFRVHRDSYGEVYFPLGVGVLLLLCLKPAGRSAGYPLLYAIPILVLTLADTVAALIGAPYGRLHYSAAEGQKSLEGSLAFALVTFLSVHIPLLLFSPTGRVQSLLIAVIVGLLVMMAEAIAWRGLDNLVIPLATYFLLEAFLHLSAAALAGQLLIVAGLGAVALAWRRRTTLNDGALMGCILAGYVILVLGGPLWLLAPLLLFVSYVPLTRPTPGDDPRSHNVRVVLSLASAGLVWLLLARALHLPALFYPFTIVFAAHLAIIGLVRGREPASRFQAPASRFPAPAGLFQAAAPDTSTPVFQAGTVPAVAIVKAWLLLLCVYLPTGESPSAFAVRGALGLAGISAAALAFYATQPGMRLGPPAPVRWNREAVCASAGSLAGLVPLLFLPHG